MMKDEIEKTSFVYFVSSPALHRTQRGTSVVFKDFLRR